MDIFSTSVAYAGSVDDFLKKVNDNIINPIILFLFALAILFFLWGMMQFILNQNNEEKVTQGKSHMLWGIIGIVIMMGVWAILGVILNTFGIPKTQIDPKEGKVQLDEYSRDTDWFE
jgi:hypothetical protein